MEAHQFEELYRGNYPALRRVATNLLRDNDAAHDVVQDVFVRLWHRKKELTAILNPGAFLYKSVVNASLNYLEQTKKRKPAPDYLELPATEQSDGAMEMRELENKIVLSIENLPPKCRAIFVLSRIEGRKNREIATLLDLSEKTVENQMGIALKKMRDALKPYLHNSVSAVLLLMAQTIIPLIISVI